MNSNRSYNSNAVYNPSINAQDAIVIRHLPQQFVMAMEHRAKNPKAKHKISTTTNAMIKGAYIDSKPRAVDITNPDRQNASLSLGLTKHDSTSPFRHKITAKKEMPQKQRPQ